MLCNGLDKAATVMPFGTGTRCVPGSNGNAPHQGGTYNYMSLPEEAAINHP